MSRTGNFGRVPRAAPSLTNTLIAIAREQAQREDQNIMEAWQKGGSVDGKKVTDAMVLKHWHDRLKDISTDDPLYDTYSNAVKQYEYSIAESKMTAKYAQIADPKAGDDTAMANFYMSWSKKVPKDSEFYRVLLRDAGQYMRAAKAHVARKVRANTEKIYHSQMDRLEAANERAGQNALRIVTMLGQEGSRGRGAVLGESPLGAAAGIVDKTNLASLQLPGAEQMIALLGTVMRTDLSRKTEDLGGPEKANAAVLYTDENGQPVTGKSIVAMFKAADPHFDGVFDMKYVQGLIQKQRDGIQKRIDLARKTGHISDSMALQQDQAKINEYGREIAAWPVAVEYSDLHDQLKRALEDETLLPDAKVAAITKLRAKIGDLASDKRIAEDGHMQSQLRGEASGSVGSLSLAEDLAGTHDGYATPTGNTDIEYVNQQLELYTEQKKQVESGKMVMTQGDYLKDQSGKVSFVPSTQGKSIGAATMDAINNLPGVGKPVPVMVPNGDGGGATPMYVVPAPITATVKNLDGTAMTSMNSNPVGGYIRYMVNGVPTTMYSIQREDGTTTWSYDPPWDQSKVKVSESNGVLSLELQNSPTGVNLNQNGSLGNGYEVVGAQPAEGGRPAKAGQLVFDPKGAVYHTDMARQYAGHDPVTDSFSASLAAVKTAPDGPSLLQQWTGDPRFMAILDNNAHLAAGQTYDAITGMWNGGNSAAYGENINAMNSDINHAKTGQTFDSNPALRDSWWRDRTDTKMSGAPAGTVPGPNGTAIPMSTTSPLATSVIQNDSKTHMQALAAGFTSAGMLKKPGDAGDGRGMGPQITLGAPLTVPTVAASAYVPPPPPPPSAPPPTPAATSSAGMAPPSGYDHGSSSYTTTPPPPPKNSGSGGSYGQHGK